MKSTKLFMAAALVALLTIAGGSLFASPLLFTSPQKEATATEFWSDADLFLSPRGYAGVEFDKFFGAVSFASSTMMQLGFATKFNDLYVAAYYGGNNWIPFEDTYSINKDGKKVYANISDLNGPDENTSLPNNNAALVIGVADMGFRLSYTQTYRAVRLNDFFIGAVKYKSFVDEYGSINPQIAWGMTKNLTENGIKPHAYFDMDFLRNYESSDTGSGVEIDSNGALNLSLTAAAGGYSLFEQNGFEFGVDLWYTFNVSLFNNKYTPTPGKILNCNGQRTDVGGPVDAGDPSLGNYDFYDVSANSHELFPYLYACWSGEKLSLSGELELGLGLDSRRNTGLYKFTGPVPAKQDDDTQSLTFSFTPTLYLGLQWAIVPEKFFLNAGSTIKFFDLSLTTLTIDKYNKNIKQGDTEKEVVKAFDGAYTALMLGFTFNPTPNLSLQAMSGIDNGIGGTNTINLFDINAAKGLAVFSKIMVTLKF